MNFTFPGQRSDEQVILVSHRHWIAYAPDMLFGIVGAIAPFIVLAVLPMADVDVASSPTRNILVVAYSLWFFALTTWLFIRWLDYYLDLCVITDSRVVDIDQFGLFRRNVAELEFDEVQDVTVTKSGILAAVFNFGHIEIQTAGEKRNFFYNTVPNPEYIVSVLSQSRDSFTSGKRMTVDEPMTAQETPSDRNAGKEDSTAEAPPQNERPESNSYQEPVSEKPSSEVPPTVQTPNDAGVTNNTANENRSTEDDFRSIPREPE